MASVETNIRGPGRTPRAIAVFRSTSAYMAPSVPRSRIVVKPFIRRGDVALQEQVRVRVDQAGEEPGIAEVDDLHAGRRQLRRRPYFGDTASSHRNGEL